MFVKAAQKTFPGLWTVARELLLAEEQEHQSEHEEELLGAAGVVELYHDREDLAGEVVEVVYPSIFVVVQRNVEVVVVNRDRPRPRHPHFRVAWQELGVGQLEQLWAGAEVVLLQVLVEEVTVLRRQ